VDDLFFEFARLIEGLQPRVFTAENVSGLVKGVAKGYFLEILAKLKACGYASAAKSSTAQWLGVPAGAATNDLHWRARRPRKDPVFPKPRCPTALQPARGAALDRRGMYGPAWKSANAPSPR